MSTPCRMTRPHNFPLKNFDKKDKVLVDKGSYHYMYRALIDYKKFVKVKNFSK